jgi:MFS family permease
VSGSNRRLTLVATIVGSSIAILDSSVVSVALPSIQRSLGGGLAGQQWVSNAYLLTLGSLILLGGSLGDIFGEHRIFALGVGGFGLTSLLCALAPTIGLLVAFRALQGVAGALLTPSSLAVIVSTFPERERGPAIGTWTAWGTIAGALGPLVAGLILNVASWRWIFVINLPLVGVCLWLIAKAVPSAKPTAAHRRVDVIGALLGVLGLGGTVFALIEQPRLGWSEMDARVKGELEILVVDVVHGGGWWGRAAGASATTTVTLRCAGRDRRTVSGRELPRTNVASRDRIDHNEDPPGGSHRAARPHHGERIGARGGRARRRPPRAGCS